METLMETRFLPAERLSVEDVERQASRLRDMPLVQQLLDASPSPLAILNAQRQIVLYNSALEALARPADELKGQRLGEALGCVHAWDGPGGCGTSEYCRECGAARAIEAALGGGKFSKRCLMLRDGETGSPAAELLATALPMPGLGPGFIACGMQDTSDSNRRQLLERTFLHDLVNTAGAIRGTAEMLETEHRSAAPEAAELLDLLKDAAHLLVEEVESYRILLAAERRELALRLTDEDAGEILQQAISLARHSGLAHRREIRAGIPSLPIPLMTDRTLLRRVLTNLILNALEATPPEGWIGISVRRAAGEVLFEVQNTGVMEDSVRRQIFKRSFTTKGAGRGIGTYSVKLLTEDYLKGSVQFESTAERGTVFGLRLPCP